VIWPRDSLLPGGRGRKPRERSRKGRGFNTPQWDSAWSDWLGSYGSCWLEVGAEGGLKLDLRKDRDPGKQKLKGAVRTKTYWRHYCQHLWRYFQAGTCFINTYLQMLWDKNPFHQSSTLILYLSLCQHP
jgi:hypothetical protein